MASSKDLRLARPITLKSGKRLTTIPDAGEFLRARFQRVNRYPMLEGEIEDLIKAAQTGTAEDRAAATDQVHRVLADNDLADPAPQEGLSDIERRIMWMHRPFT